jgi:hypothetical protein
MLVYTFTPFQTKEQRWEVIRRIKKELQSLRTIPVCIVVVPGARAPKIFNNNPRVTIER